MTTTIEKPKLVLCVATLPGVIGTGPENMKRIREGEQFYVEEGIIGTWFKPVDGSAFKFTSSDPKRLAKMQKKADKWKINVDRADDKDAKTAANRKSRASTMGAVTKQMGVIPDLG